MKPVGSPILVTLATTPGAFGGMVVTAFSFNIPLAKALGAEHVHYILPGGLEVSGETLVPPTECTGSAAAPTAEPGNLCVYETEADGVEVGGKGGDPDHVEIFPAGSSPVAFGGTEDGASTSGAGLFSSPTRARDLVVAGARGR
jgi:hypothetical protein